MSDCPNCTDEEFCSDACANADEPCPHGEIEDLAERGRYGDTTVSLARCLDCGELLNHHHVSWGASDQDSA